MTEPRVALLEARGLRLSRAGREVVHGADLDLHRGEVTALLGPNGAGKSTLLDGLAGALAPAGGEVRVHGRVALALQSPDLARRSVAANVDLALQWWGVPRRERSERVRAALAALAIDHLAQRAAASLSGGERRRVHLARAVALRCAVLLLDEPFAGLDPAARAALLEDAGAALRAGAGTTLVVVHDRAEAWALADRLLVMLDGCLVADGAPRALLEAPPTAEVARFLGFDGCLAEEDGTLLTRPHHVTIDRDGPLTARVSRVIPLEDGVRVELDLAAGRVYANAPLQGIARGEEVRVCIDGGVRFAGLARDAPGPPRAPAAPRQGPYDPDPTVAAPAQDSRP